MSRLYGAGNCWLRFSGVCSKLYKAGLLTWNKRLSLLEKIIGQVQLFSIELVRKILNIS